MRRKLLLATSIVFLVSQTASADDVRYYTENGVTYRETRRVVRRPVSETRLERREETVYRERTVTEYQETTRVCSVPVTEYRWEAHWAGRWNPFRQPYLEYRLVPYTYCKPRTEVVRVPVVRREMVPEKRIVQVPVTTLRFVEEEQISRVAVSGGSNGLSPTSSPSYIASRDRIGGVSRLESDPPRYGNSGWRSAGTVTLRR